MRDVTIPEISENVDSGSVLSVLVSKGDSVSKDQTLLELETDKAAVDLPSPASGTVAEILVSEGDEVNVGDTVMKLDERDSEEADAAEPNEETGDEDDSESVDRSDGQDDSGSGTEARDSGAGSADIPASPSTRRFAREIGVDLTHVSGTGPGGRISRDDVKRAARDGGAQEDASTEQGHSDRVEKHSTDATGDTGDSAEDRRESMSRVRRLTAENTAQSWAAPHVTHFDEADVGAVEEFIDASAKKAEQAGGKLTITAVLIVLCAEALRRFPRFNASVDMERSEIVYHDRVHIGVAVDTDRGLLVPVVRDADRKGVVEIATELVELADRTRSGKISPDELSGGTFTISNLGSIGGTGFTPVIQAPQVAILAVSRTATRPAYDGQRFQPRRMLPLGLAYDHRANDGADAARFMRWLRTAIEDPFTALMEGGAHG